MVVMNKKGEVIVAHNGRKELRLTFGKEGVRARSELSYKAFYLTNKDMYIRSTPNGYASENLEFSSIRLEVFLDKAMKELGCKFTNDGSRGEASKAASYLMKGVKDDMGSKPFMVRWNDLNKKAAAMGGMRVLLNL
jgi:hypothetical protein